MVVEVVIGIIAVSYNPSQSDTTTPQPVIATVTAVDLSIQYTGIISEYLGTTSSSLTT